MQQIPTKDAEVSYTSLLRIKVSVPCLILSVFGLELKVSDIFGPVFRRPEEAHAAEPQRDREATEGQDEHLHQRAGHHDPHLHEHVKVGHDISCCGARNSNSTIDGSAT